MANVSTIIQDKNANIALELLEKYGEFVECKQITYYVNDEQLLKKEGKIMINRRDNYPKIQILKPSIENYTESFQENSSVFTDMGNLDVISIQASYTPYSIGKLVDVKAVIVF